MKLIHPFIAPDERGYFLKYYEKQIFKDHGIFLMNYESNFSKSKKGTVRGLHFQSRHSQDKLVHVLQGKVFDVGVDLRKDSPTFGQWRGFQLSEQNHDLLYIPKGFAHGFLVLSEEAVFGYLCGDRYDPESDGGIFWKDPEIAVKWPLELVSSLILSEKDQHLQSFAMFKQKTGGF